uniref:bifunctional DNA primase/polymerase n=1 Tax=Orrella sp. TaxID=1921583 RepID=UPI004048148D
MSNVSIQSLIDSGIALVGMPYGEKGPRDRGWNLRNSAITEPKQAVALNGKNVGIAHAYCTPTPTCAIDIDDYNNSIAWLASHGIDLASLLQQESAVVIWSGKQGSLKIIYRLPHNVKPMESKRIVGLGTATILEFRCATKDGKTVQDVIPPSLHPDGHHYAWFGGGTPLLIPTIPVDLFMVWQQLITNSSRVAHRYLQHQPAIQAPRETPQQIAKINLLLSYISADCDYELWRNVVWAILSTKWLCAENLALSWSQSAPDRFDKEAFWLVANSYMPNHPNQITIGTLHHFAKLGGWNG